MIHDKRKKLRTEYADNQKTKTTFCNGTITECEECPLYDHGYDQCTAGEKDTTLPVDKLITY